MSKDLHKLNQTRNKMVTEMERLEIERETLRDWASGEEVSSWKFWQGRFDDKIINMQRRICEINSILKGYRVSSFDTSVNKSSTIKDGEE